MIFKFYRNERNRHGTQSAGEPWNEMTVTGPKFKLLKLRRDSPGISRRLIFYFPSGAWWNLDVFSKRRVV